MLDPAQGRLPAVRGRGRARGRGDPQDPQPGEKLGKLRASAHPQAQFLWATFRDVFHYCAYHLESIADNARDVDLAIRWGFGWDMGPFETWQAAGWKEVAGWIAEDIAAGRSLAKAPLPAWVTGAKVAAVPGVHTPKGSYAPAADAFHGRSTLPVYRRQLFPDAVLGERADPGTTVFETDAVRMWHLGDDIAILSFKTKMNTISEEVLDGILRACDEAEKGFAGLVLWQRGEPFSLGADLSSIAPAAVAGQWSAVEAVVAKFQQTSLALRYCLVPTVAAVRGMALGGSCEFVLHCDRTVAALESYIGLVEVGVGLLPGGGGCKEFAVRAAEESRRGAAGSQIDMLPVLRAYFQTIATATSRRARWRRRRSAISGRATSSCPMRAKCCTSRRRRHARWPRPATGRRCGRATSPSPAAPASRRSR